MIDQASKKIDVITPQARSLTVSYLSLPPEKYEYAREQIDAFCYRLIREIGENESPNAKLYVLSTQLFSIDRGDSSPLTASE